MPTGSWIDFLKAVSNLHVSTLQATVDRWNLKAGGVVANSHKVQPCWCIDCLPPSHGTPKALEMAAVSPDMAFLPPTVIVLVAPSESSSLELPCFTTRAKHTSLDSLALLAYRKRLFKLAMQVLFPLPDTLFLACSSSFIIS